MKTNSFPSPHDEVKSPSANEFRQARKEAGLTQTEAGALIYCSRRTVQDWESGKNRIHPAFWEFFQIKLKEHQKRKASASH
jgi:DNA-binding transcriptional regulator YiaG